MPELFAEWLFPLKTTGTRSPVVFSGKYINLMGDDQL